MVDGICEKYKYMEVCHENESWKSSKHSNTLQPTVIYPNFCSYSSLETLSCSNLDKEEYRLVKLHNTIKKLLTIIYDPLQKEDIGFICYLLNKFLKYNGLEGYYLEHLRPIGEILEFLSMQAKHIEDYLDFLYELLNLSAKAPLLHKFSEICLCAPKLQRHLNLLGSLLILVPTRKGFLLVKAAIEQLINGSNEKMIRNDVVKLAMVREAIDGSRLPITLIELLAIASTEAYMDILELLLAIFPISTTSCITLMEAGIENQLLLRMHPTFESGLKSISNSNNMNLQCNESNYYKIAEASTKILWQILTTTVISKDKVLTEKKFNVPSADAMKSLHVAFRREVFNARSSSRSQKLRNDLANLILAKLVAYAFSPKWNFLDSGIADDLAIVVAITECGTEGTWAASVIIETRSQKELHFKRTLLLIIALLVETQPETFLFILINRKIMYGVLELIIPNFEAPKTFWNLQQLRHLFKYVSNALIYLAPKIPKEFIEYNGSMRLISMLEQLTENNFDSTYTVYFTEMICSLSSANCEILINDFRKFNIVPLLLKLINRILNFEALSITRQKTITFLLITNQNIMDSQDSIQELNHDSVVKTAIELLQRCLLQKNKDSILQQSFLIAIGCFICKCIVTWVNVLNSFLREGGIYLILDNLKNMNMYIQNFYLDVIIDLCKNESSIYYLKSWRCADKHKGLLSLLIKIWKEEMKIFGVHKNVEDCQNDIKSVLMNDDQTLYLYFIKSLRNSSTIITTAARPARPKIYILIELLRAFKKHKEGCSESFFFNDELSIEEKVTMLEIDAYMRIKENEAIVEIIKIMDEIKIRPLTESSKNLYSVSQKLYSCYGHGRKDQEKLIELWLAEKIHEEEKELKKIRDSKLNSVFDALEELAFVGRTSVRDYMLVKKVEQRAKIEVGITKIEKKSDPPFHRTYNFNANVTAVFNQHLKLRSISESYLNSKKNENLSMVSSFASLVSEPESICSLVTVKSDFSFLNKKYKIDANDTVI